MTLRTWFSRSMTMPVAHNVITGGISTGLIAAAAVAYQLIVGYASGCPDKYGSDVMRGEIALSMHQAQRAAAIADDLIDNGATCACVYVLKAAASAQELFELDIQDENTKKLLQSDCRKYANKALGSAFDRPRAKALATLCSAEASLAPPVAPSDEVPNHAKTSAVSPPHGRRTRSVVSIRQPQSPKGHLDS